MTWRNNWYTARQMFSWGRSAQENVWITSSTWRKAPVFSAIQNFLHYFDLFRHLQANSPSSRLESSQLRGFVQGESLLVLFKASHFWLCSRWVTFGFLVAKTTHQHTDLTKQQTSTTKSKSRKAPLTHFDPSIQDHYVVSKRRAPNTLWRGVTFQDKWEL